MYRQREMAILHPRLHFLGLSRELRDLIYDFWLLGSPHVKHCSGIVHTLLLQASAPPNPMFLEVIGRDDRRVFLFINKQIHAEFLLRCRASLQAEQDVCYAWSFNHGLDTFIHGDALNYNIMESESHKLSPMNRKHIKLHLHKIHEGEAAWTDDHVLARRNYTAALIDLQNMLARYDQLERFEIEWRVENLPDPGRVDPVTSWGLDLTTTRHMTGMMWLGPYRYEALDNIPRRNIREYGRIIAWRRRFDRGDSYSNWRIQFFDKPLAYSWFDHRIVSSGPESRRLEPLWSRVGPRIALTQVPIAHEDAKS